MKKGTFIIISSTHWHQTWQRHHHIAMGMLKREYEVVFIEPLPKRWPTLKEVSRIFSRLVGNSQGSGTCPQNEAEDLNLILPKVLPDLGSLTQGLNQKCFIPPIVKKIERLNLPRPWITVNYLPTHSALELQQKLNPELSIYDCVSDWSDNPYARNLIQTEETLFKEVDIVIADSNHNKTRSQKVHSHVVRIEGGVDFDRFEKVRNSASVKREKPLCAYFGDIGVHQDWALLKEVSERFLLRLIGPVRVPIEDLSSETDIKGPVSYEALPSLLEDVDVLLLPYRRTKHNGTIMPAKTFECLATGKPTVVIGLPDLKEYRDHFYYCENERDFLSAIEKAYAENDASLREKRISVAREKSWTARLDELERLVQKTLEQGAS